MPVENNEHQRIDDVSTDRISYIILQLEWISQSESSITSEYKSVFHT